MKEVSINKNIKLSQHLASPSEAALSQISELNGLRLSPHFTLGELCKTSYHPVDGNIPSRVAIENLRNICEGWLEDLRFSYNELYGFKESGDRSQESVDIPVVITSGYRSEEVNRLCGGAKGSNHLTGCAVDIRCAGPEQLIRYSSILLDIADGTRRDFDELIHEKRGTTWWIHFAVRPSGNRRKILFDMR
jgi:hypothetical protein